MTIKLDPKRPIYQQIIEEIKKRTVRGLYSPGGKLPSVRDMAKEIEVNPNTIARVYIELERGGFIETRRGQGSYITNDSTLIDTEKTKLIHNAVEAFLNEMEDLNLDEHQRERLIESIRVRLLKNVKILHSDIQHEED